MIDTRLILVEGLGGSGKTTTARYLEQILRSQGFEAAAILESYKRHPRFQFPNDVEHYTARMLEEWSLFLAARAGRAEVCLLEGHGWQPMAEFMYLAGYTPQAVIEFCADVASIISPLDPVLVYYAQEDVASHLRRVERLRVRQWISSMESRDTMHHGLDKFGGRLLQFWSEWAVLQEELYSRCPFPKLRLRDPHGDWDAAYTKIRNFIQLA